MCFTKEVTLWWTLCPSTLRTRRAPWANWAAIVWPVGFLAPYRVLYEGASFVTLTPEMQERMKAVIADFYGVVLRDKDKVDVRALELSSKTKSPRP